MNYFRDLVAVIVERHSATRHLGLHTVHTSQQEQRGHISLPRVKLQIKFSPK